MNKEAMLEVLAYIKITDQDGSVFATYDPLHHEVCDELIVKGWILETTSLHMAPESKDRCYQMTVKGRKEVDFIWIGDIVEQVKQA